MKKWVCVFAGLAAMAVRAEVTLSNVSVQQLPGTKTVEIAYDLTGTGSFDVSLAVSNGMQAVSAASLSGDVGAGVPVGAGKKIVWNGGADWDGQAAALQYTLTADDGINAVISCPVSKTGQTVKERNGDDGDLEEGVAWPSPRFTDLGDTILDNLTGLEWVEDPHSLSGNSSFQSWNNAIDFCDGLSFSGDSDWRLPNVKELLSLLDYGRDNPALPSGNPFDGIKYTTFYAYWTGNSVSIEIQPGNVVDYALYVDMRDGAVRASGASGYVWPVRLRQAGAPAPVPKTGQTVVYRSGDDGDQQAGTAWPNPRFIDLGNTVLDNLTGLEWAQEPEGSGMVWNDAVDFCNGLSLEDHSDWRLPNLKELESLVHYGVDGTAGWLNDTFSGVEASTYWSGTSYAYNTGNAWGVNMGGGGTRTGNLSKSAGGYVWPVRTWESENDVDVASSSTDTRDYILVVVSDHGNPEPAVGTNTYAWGTNLTLSAGSESNVLCTGWSGTGSVPASGTNDTVGSIVLTNNLSSSILWNWEQILEGFALWADDLGLPGTPEEVFVQDRNGDGIANGFEYAFGDNLPGNGPLLHIILENGEPVVEIPEQAAATTSDVSVVLNESTDLNDWMGVATNEVRFVPESAKPAAYFRLEADLN